MKQTIYRARKHIAQRALLIPTLCSKEADELTTEQQDYLELVSAASILTTQLQDTALPTPLQASLTRLTEALALVNLNKGGPDATSP